MGVGFIRLIRFSIRSGLGTGVCVRTGMGEFVEFIAPWRKEGKSTHLIVGCGNMKHGNMRRTRESEIFGYAPSSTMGA